MGVVVAAVFMVSVDVPAVLLFGDGSTTLELKLAVTPAGNPVTLK